MFANEQVAKDAEWASQICDIQPVFEARNDYDIFADIAERLGKREQFTEGKAEMDWIRSFYEAGRVAARGKSIEMPIFDAFWNSDNPLAFPIEDAAKSYIQYKEFRDDPLLNALGTPSGRFENFLEEHRENALRRLPAAPDLD